MQLARIEKITAKNWRISALIATGLLVGCVSQGPKLVQSTDPYSKKSQYAFGPIKAEDCPTRSRGNGFVDVQFVGTDGLHTMSVSYLGDRWLFLSTSTPMDILIDGKSSQLVPINSPSRDVIHGRQVRESLYYPVTQDFVRKLADAKTVQFRILGAKGNLEQCLSSERIKSIEKVVPLLP